jgi:polyhydroxybutyrate depolymerase
VTKVFIVGHSNGGFMALRLACEASDVFDGIVAVSASTWNDAAKCPDGRAVPLLLVHGTADDTIPYEGKDGLYPSARGTAERFTARAGCAANWSTLGRSDFIGDSAEETVRDSTGCAASPVELWTIEEGPHALVFDGKWTGAVFEWLTEKSK